MSNQVQFENPAAKRCARRRAVGAFCALLFILAGCAGKDAAGAGAAPGVSFSHTSLTFASQALGATSAAQALTFNNTGGVALSISSLTLGGSNAGDFAQSNNCGPIVAAGGHCTINVTFSATKTGYRTASITFTDNAAGSPQSVVLIGTSTAPNATYSPASLTFTSRTDGTSSAAQAIKLSNTGNSALSVSNFALTGANASDFAQSNNCGSSVLAGANCTISVIFTPSASGSRTALLSIADNASGSPQTIILTGAGTAAAPTVSFSPTTSNFGNQPIGAVGAVGAASTTSAAQTITLKNTGSAPLNISGLTLTGANAGDFAQSNNCGARVMAGALCTINATFKPTASGTRSAAITVTDNASGSPQTASLTGMGTAPGVSLSPTGLTFANQSLGATSAAQALTLKNTGGAALSISSLTLGGSNAGDFAQSNNCGSSVAAGAHCTINVIFSPTGKGYRIASITLGDNAGSSPQAAALIGTSNAPNAIISPASLTFSLRANGTTSATQAIRLSNTGNSTLSISSLVLSGANASDFAEANNCGSALQAGANCSISVSFTPSASGSRAASITVTDNATGSPQNVSLTGTGINGAPGQTVLVEPSDDLPTLVNQYPASTTFLLAPGTHRLQSVVPKSHDSFEGQTGAILSGAALLTTFTPDGAYWTAKVEVGEVSYYRGKCNSTSPACIYPEDLFFNNTPKARVASLSAVGPGKWYLDYNTGTAYMGDSPSGSTVEISLMPHAFTGNAQSVVIRNLIIEKYACQAGSGAVDGRSGSLSWTVENSEIRYNHGMGIGTGDGMYIYENNVHNNGQLGMGGGGANVTVSSNQISHNNYAGYSYYFEAGGAKFCAVTNLTVKNNSSYDNDGPGFWNDMNSQTVTYSGNQTAGNSVAGILFEISYGATITNNTITNDGYNPDESPIWIGGGIVISNSSDVTISGNTISNCMNGIGGIIQDRGENPSGTPYTLENVVAHGNTITQSTGMAMGIVEDPGYGNAVYTTMGNNFQGNTFVLANPAASQYFYWMGEYMTLATWDSEVNR